MTFDTNDFSNPAIEIFLAHVRGCTMTQAAFFAIKFEGILYPFDLNALGEEDLGNKFTNMLCPPPTVTMGVSIPVQGINLSIK